MINRDIMKTVLNKEKICCLVITYNSSDLLNLINNIKEQVDKIIIIDNNSDFETQKDLIKLSKEYNIRLIFSKENIGIAGALNRGITEARKFEYEWVITFDQDSIPFINIVELISEVYNLYTNKNDIGAIGVNFPMVNEQSYFNFSKTKRYRKKDYLITSGCLLSLNTLFSIGGFREDLFIDNVDLEYSLRLRKNNKVSLITQEWGMFHKVGDPKRKKIGPIYVSTSNHNWKRRYYMARNHVILCKEYFLYFPYFILKLNFFFFLSLFQILFLECDRRNKIRNSFQGIVDGMFYSKSKRKYLHVD